MPNIAKVLKDEIARIARREAKAAVNPVKKPARGLRKTAADLRTKVASLEKEVKALQRALSGLTKAQPAAAAVIADKARITAKGVRSLRRRLRLSGQEFAKLLGITPQMVYHWDKAKGPLKVRAKTRAAILAIRDIGSREARRLLEAMKPAARPRKKAAPRRKRR